MEMKLSKKIYHTGINVSDMDRSLNFYVDLLGCEVLSDNEVAGENVDKGLGLKDASFRQVYLKIGSDEIELFQYRTGMQEGAGSYTDTSGIGIRHITFVVYDLEEAYKVMLDSGIEFLSEPITNPDGVKWVFLKDPDNYFVELVELAE